jgi:hypothetical protein
LGGGTQLSLSDTSGFTVSRTAPAQTGENPFILNITLNYGGMPSIRATDVTSSALLSYGFASVQNPQGVGGSPILGQTFSCAVDGAVAGQEFCTLLADFSVGQFSDRLDLGESFSMSFNQFIRVSAQVPTPATVLLLLAGLPLLRIPGQNRTGT